MKKTIITITLVLLVAFAGTQAFAYRSLPSCCDSFTGAPAAPGAPQGPDALQAPDPETQKKFLAETAELRKSLAADRAEFGALMSQDAPDVKRIRELAASIFETRDQIQAKAQELGMPLLRQNRGSGCPYSDTPGRGPNRGKNRNRGNYGNRGNCGNCPQ